jgi:type II secretory pathway predicted ATPase ExeA
MYRHFFGLRDHPFGLNPDPRYLFLTPQTQEALDTLILGIEMRKGLIMLTGEVGTGKTTLIHRLLDWLHQQQTPTAFVSNPRLEPHHLFDFMLTDFGVSSAPRTNSDPRIRLKDCLLEHYRAGRNSVLIVDEAQGLSLELLEEIRLLLNLETPREKLLQVVLVGQPEMEEKFTRHELRQLRQRIALRCKTAPLTCEETQAYIQARLRIAGSGEKPIFEPSALETLHFYARGIPRVINVLGEHSLISAYTLNLRPVTASIVDEAAREFQLDDTKRVARPVDFGDTASTPTFASIPFVVARSTTLAERGSNSSSLDYGRPSAHGTFSELMRKETARMLDSTEFTSEDAFRLLCKFAQKSQTIASEPTGHKVESSNDVPALAQRSSPSHLETSAPRLITKYETMHTLQAATKMPSRKLQTRRIRQRPSRTMRWSAIASSVRLTQIVVTWLQLPRPVTNLASLKHQTAALIWRGRSWLIASREMTAPLIRWLQEPWGQMPGSLPARGIHARGQPH